MISPSAPWQAHCSAVHSLLGPRARPLCTRTFFCASTPTNNTPLAPRVPLPRSARHFLLEMITVLFPLVGLCMGLLPPSPTFWTLAVLYCGTFGPRLYRISAIPHARSSPMGGKLAEGQRRQRQRQSCGIPPDVRDLPAPGGLLHLGSERKLWVVV